MEEIWKPVPEYNGNYEASNLGRIRSSKTKKILRQANHRQGYKLVRLYKNGKGTTKTVHRIIASAFIENPENLTEVNHKDENKSNNSAENLEWCSRIYNANYGTGIERRNAIVKAGILEGRIKTRKGISINAGENNPNSKLSDEDVKYIRKHYKKNDKEFGGVPLSEKFGVTKYYIYRIVSGKRRRKSNAFEVP
jgi:hypothetical protein